jgi:hypothetical protein
MTKYLDEETVPVRRVKNDVSPDLKNTQKFKRKKSKKPLFKYFGIFLFLSLR